VNVQEVDRGNAEPVEALPGRPPDVLGREVPRVALRGEEYFLAVDRRAGEPLADRSLVVVHLRGVDVPVAQVERPPDRLDALLARQPRRAEAARRA
jgi:hypothetical protein